MSRATKHKTKHEGVYFRLDAQDRKRYIVNYKDIAGKWRFAPTLPLGTTERKAVKRREELNTDHARGDAVVDTDKTLSDAIDEWLTHVEPRLEHRTIKNYRYSHERYVRAGLGQRKLVLIDSTHLAKLITELRGKDLSEGQIGNIMKPVKVGLGWARRKKWIVANPWLELERGERPRRETLLRGNGKQMRILAPGEIERLIQVKPAHRTILFEAAICTGLRLGELITLRWRDVDFDRGIINARSLKKKNRDARHDVLMTGTLGRRLREHRLASYRSGDDDYVFVNENGDPVTVSTADKWLKKALADAGVAHCRFHALRHTCASWMHSLGFEVSLITKQLNHENVAITQSVYMHLFNPEERLEEARERMDADWRRMTGA